MWVVRRCVQDYGDVWKSEEASFDTEAEADAYVDREDKNSLFSGVWFEVDEEQE